MTPITGSSNISHAGYDPRIGVLSVRFKSGVEYDYQNVTAKQHAAFLAADSPGGWVAEHLVRKPINHPYKQREKPKKK